jgi:hypothetical protein
VRLKLRRVADNPSPDRVKPLTAPQGEKNQNPRSKPNPSAKGDAPAVLARPLDPAPAGFSRVMAIHPADSDRIFVDVTAYNSHYYYVHGDVANPGRLPFTGKETVFDALNYAGGLIATADARKIQLVRPGVAGKPPRVYAIDFDAIVKRGEATANYQVFPGDRIVVGRNAVEQATIEIDRVARQIQSVQNSMLMSSLVMRSLAQGATNPFSPGSPISVRVNLGGMTWVFDAGNRTPVFTPAERDAVVKEWVDFWWKAASRPDGAPLDQATFREALMRQLTPPVTPGEGGKD